MISPFKLESEVEVTQTGSVDWMSQLPESPDRYWRFETYCNHTVDGTYAHVTIGLWNVRRRTPKGAWVADMYGPEKWISDSASRKHCYPTKALAWDAYKNRAYWRGVFNRREADRIAAINHTIKNEDEA